METNCGSNLISWFRQHFGKPKILPVMSHTQTADSTEQRVSSPTHCTSSSQGSSQSSAQPLLPALNVPFHLTYRFDVCVCHSDKNISQAEALVSFLESPSRKLRCYLQIRDCPPGGAISTELCKAIRSSYCWVLLISPNFLQDDWCLYQMQQVISEGPMSQRIIPTVLDMHISELPHELRFFYTVDLNRNQEAGYTQVYRTVLRCLKNSTLTQSRAEDYVKISGLVDPP